MTAHPGAGATAVTDPAPPGRLGRSLLVATAHVADAMDRHGIERSAVFGGLHPLEHGTVLVGPLRGVHVRDGPQDVHAALPRTRPGDVLVIDDDGRRDGACLGDRLATDAMRRGVAGVVIWGSHRDSRTIRRLGLPVLSLGPVPWRARGPRGRPDGKARLGATSLLDGDLLVADDDGVVVVPAAEANSVLATAIDIAAEEGRADLARLRADLLAEPEPAGTAPWAHSQLSTRSRD